MKRLNLVEIETRWGYRTVELYCGDLTTTEEDIDALAVSSYKGDYTPSEGSLIKALEDNCKISVRELSESLEYDFRDSLSCWIAKVNGSSQFRRLVCVEIRGGKFEVAEIIENLFIVLSILEMKGVEVRNLALPLLGAGRQELDPEEMTKAMLTSMQKHRDHFRSLTKVLFVEKNEERASQLDKEINEQLGRVKLVLPKGQLFDDLRKDIGKSLDTAEALAEGEGVSLFSDLRRLVVSDQSRWFEIGMVSRKMVEYMVKTTLPTKELEKDLWKNIDKLHHHDIAKWITSYMHVLRVFGNESAHEQDRNRHPSSIDQKDMLMCLICVQRLLEFWIEFAHRTRVTGKVSR